MYEPGFKCLCLFELNLLINTGTFGQFFDDGRRRRHESLTHYLMMNEFKGEETGTTPEKPHVEEEQIRSYYHRWN